VREIELSSTTNIRGEKMSHKTKGTKEWADSNVNIFSGCSNNCTYCYARKMAIRFKRKTNENWKVMELNKKAFKRNYRKRNGRIMFPTSHDITWLTLNENTIVLLKLLEVGNEVLITTKPDIRCIKALCKILEGHKDKVQWRFTITSMDDATLKRFEPGAPDFSSRLRSLIHAFDAGYKTSVSMEPCLDLDPRRLVYTLEPFVTESIWIGCMNHCRIGDLNSKDTLETWYEIFRDVPKIRFKDALLNKIGVKLDEK